MDKWDLTRIYKDEETFLKELKELREEVLTAAPQLKGKLGEEEVLVSYLKLDREIEKKLSMLYMFAEMRSDLNKKDVKNNEDLMLVQNAWTDIMQATSFINPEIIALGEDKINAFLAKHSEFSDFDYQFRKLFRSQTHVLSAEQEKLLSYFAPIMDDGGTLYSMLTVGDGTSKDCVLHDGKKVTVTQANWTDLVAECKDSQDDRRTIFETLYSSYEAHKNTYGAIYNELLQSELATVKARHFSSILESHLFDNNIPTDVFLNLIKTTENGSAPLKKYYELRRKAFGLEKIHSYDRFLQLAESDKKYTYAEAKDMFWDSVKKFPADFQAKAHEVLKDGYVDVYPFEGKRSGAYSNGGDDLHPYILFNFNGSLEDCFTVAHESGHSIHTLYAMENQPLIKQGYTIFVAEIASTFNEHNLLDYLMDKGSLTKQERIMLLQKEIDEIVSTFYRQALFGQFEYEMSLKAERGEPISYQGCCEEMVKLYKAYYGIDINEEKVKPFVWAYIPHLFYTPFYVYQYATSFSASYQFYKNVKEKKPHAFENYLSLLKAGGSDYPIDEVRKAGVDLTTAAPFEAMVSHMSELVDELEKELNSK